MSSGKEREVRAFEALIVSQLRKECDPDKVDPRDLPRLTKKEKAALKSLGPNLVERLWNQEEESAPIPPITTHPMSAGEFVLNRAEDVDDETAQELSRRKAELLERMRKLKDEKSNG